MGMMTQMSQMTPQQQQKKFNGCVRESLYTGQRPQSRHARHPLSIIPPHLFSFMNTEMRFVDSILTRLLSERLETNASNMSTRAEDRNGSAVLLVATTTTR